jgi:hypothetical protein
MADGFLLCLPLGSRLTENDELCNGLKEAIVRKIEGFIALARRRVAQVVLAKHLQQHSN